MKQFLFVITWFACLLSCKGPQQVTGSASNNTAGIAVTGKLFASLYQQRAAEYHALCLQAYNLATQRVNEILKTRTSAKPMAVITDIDETVLD
ncbi:MAG TPA: HAD family acid phosphatase, partial [Chitinophagaceae bacterium]|nr:HAD family acid phosphatase [Chitinophagaceae bacterium]